MTALRPVDLARLAGISTQQVRNYADAGILPPAGRSAAGYRRFADRHRRAMLTYRALGRGYGWYTARDVMHAVHSGDVPRALALIDAGHAALHDERRSLRTVAEALAATASSGEQLRAEGRATYRGGGGPSRCAYIRSAGLGVGRAAGAGRSAAPATGSTSRIALRDARIILMLRQDAIRCRRSSRSSTGCAGPAAPTRCAPPPRNGRPS